MTFIWQVQNKIVFNTVYSTGTKQDCEKWRLFDKYETNLYSIPKNAVYLTGTKQNCIAMSIFVTSPIVFFTLAVQIRYLKYCFILEMSFTRKYLQEKYFLTILIFISQKFVVYLLLLFLIIFVTKFDNVGRNYSVVS